VSSRPLKALVNRSSVRSDIYDIYLSLI
jgi:hypothetical protein